MLHADWKNILKRAWSIRWMALAALFSAAEVMVPMLPDKMPRGLFAILTGVAVGGAFISRLMAQRDVD